MSCSYLYKWLFGAEMFSGLSRNAPQTRDTQNVCAVTKGGTVLKSRHRGIVGRISNQLDWFESGLEGETLLHIVCLHWEFQLPTLPPSKSRKNTRSGR